MSFHIHIIDNWLALIDAPAMERYPSCWFDFANIGNFIEKNYFLFKNLLNIAFFFQSFFVTLHPNTTIKPIVLCKKC